MFLCFPTVSPLLCEMQFGIANIPPVVMFNAKIFKPSRLCAVYRIEGMSEAAREVLKERVLRLR